MNARMIRLWSFLVILFCSLQGVGCDKPSTSTKQSQKEITDKQKVANIPSKSLSVELEAIELDPLMARIDKEKGKIVVVDIWASWCINCMKKFPNLVKLQEKHAKDGVVCMSVTVDKQENSEKALAFLKKQNALLPNFQIDQKTWFDKWDIKGIPVVLVFDQNGNFKKFSQDDPDNPFTYEDVEKHVQALLEKK